MRQISQRIDVGENKQKGETHTNCKLQTRWGIGMLGIDHLAMGDLLAPFPRRYSRMRNARGEPQANVVPSA